MNVRSQITPYVILGLLILVAAIFLLNFQMEPAAKTMNAQEETLNQLEDSFNAVSTSMDECAKLVVINAIEENGLNKTGIETQINSHLIACVGSTIAEYQQRGIDISVQSIDTNVDISTDVIVVTIEYPMQFSSKGSSKKVSYFYSNIPRTVYARIPYDSNCMVTSDVGAISFDKKASLTLPKGVIAKKSDGTCLEEIQIRLDNPLSSVISLAPISYNALPQGSTFDPYIIFEFRYTDKDYTDYVSQRNAAGLTPIPENDLSIAYYDTVDGVYRPYDFDPAPLQNVAYPGENRIIANISHFTDVVISADCNGLENIAYPQITKTAQILNSRCGDPTNCTTCPDSLEPVSFTYKVESDGCLHKSLGIRLVTAHPDVTCPLSLASSAGAHSLDCEMLIPLDQCKSFDPPWVILAIEGVGVTAASDGNQSASITLLNARDVEIQRRLNLPPVCAPGYTVQTYLGDSAGNYDCIRIPNSPTSWRTVCKEGYGNFGWPIDDIGSYQCLFYPHSLPS
ncbi:MAG TPA: hypothetical protein VJH97_04100 [Candidatus Nanoarchaeia archaeon]|nr:hypothetical protein [Candidatus Nanoarchaeia archaeon]